MLKLNLLPVERKRAWALAQQLQQWRGAMLVVVIACVFSNGTMLGLDLFQGEAIKNSKADLKGWEELNSKRESGQVTATTTALNATISGLQMLFTPFSTQTVTAANLLASLPPGIQLTSLRVANDGAFVLAGVAATRTSFLALRTALDDNPTVANVTTTSTASLRENLPFEYTGSLVLKP